MKRLATIVTLAILLVGLVLLGSSCAPQATLEISVTELDNGVMVENVGNVDCLVFVNSPEGEQQFELAVAQGTVEEELQEQKWYRVFSLVIYSLMGLGALTFLIISIRRYRLPKVVKTLGKAGLASTVFFCGADLILVLIFATTGQDLSGTFWGLSGAQWLMVWAILGAVVLAPTVYVIKKTGFLEKFADKSLSVKILTVCISIFGLVAAGWGLWEALLKHIPFLIVAIVLLAFVLFFFVTGMGGLIAGLQEEYKTPREKLARDIARAIKEQEDDD